MPKTPEEIAAEENAAADKAAAPAAAKEAADAAGFPASTPLEQMTVEQREAYWKDKARKHEAIAKSRSDYDQMKADSLELAALKEVNATAEEKALEDARRQGEVIGAERYLKEAVKGRFQGITKKTDAEVETIFEHVDAGSFVDDEGDIDIAALTAYAATFGTSEKKPSEDPVAAALARQRHATDGVGASIAEKRRQVRESMTKKTA